VKNANFVVPKMVYSKWNTTSGLFINRPGKSGEFGNVILGKSDMLMGNFFCNTINFVNFKYLIENL